MRLAMASLGPFRRGADAAIPGDRANVVRGRVAIQPVLNSNSACGGRFWEMGDDDPKELVLLQLDGGSILFHWDRPSN